jgi:transcriptional regulator with XRE-family HTH domain
MPKEKNDYSFNRSIGEQIKKLRNSGVRKETQVELAKKIGLSVSMISKIERGVLSLTLQNAIKIAKHYNVSVDMICRGIDFINNPSIEIDRFCELFYYTPFFYNQKKTYPFATLNIDSILDDFAKSMKNATDFKKSIPEQSERVNQIIKDIKLKFIDELKEGLGGSNVYALIPKEKLENKKNLDLLTNLLI